MEAIDLIKKYCNIEELPKNLIFDPWDLAELMEEYADLKTKELEKELKDLEKIGKDLW